ncbi:MAG: tetratricopeptide repeat protein [Thermodesulfobacteriota bacterium]
MTIANEPQAADKKVTGQFFREDSGELLRASRKGAKLRVEPGLAGSFLAKALSRLSETKKFAALAVRLDKETAGLENGNRPALFSDFMGHMGRVVDRAGGVWGLLCPGVFSLVLPGADAAEAEKASRMLRDQAMAAGMGSATVAAALFPTLSYGVEEVIAHNSLKALDQASLAGPGSYAVFDSMTLAISGDRRFQENDLAAAVSEYRQALALDPQNANAENSLAVCLAMSGKNSEAVEAFLRVHEKEPGNVMPLFNLGLLCAQEGDFQGALSFFEKALAAAPDEPAAAFQAARAAQSLGDFEKAAKLYERSAKAQPEAWQPFRGLGECLFILKRPGEARKALEAAVRKNPNDAVSLSLLAEVFTALDVDTDIALSFARQSVDLDPGQGRHWLRLARLLERSGDQYEAARAYEKARSLGIMPETDGAGSGEAARP